MVHSYTIVSAPTAFPGALLAFSTMPRSPIAKTSRWLHFRPLLYYWCILPHWTLHHHACPKLRERIIAVVSYG